MEYHTYVVYNVLLRVLFFGSVSVFRTDDGDLIILEQVVAFVDVYYVIRVANLESANRRGNTMSASCKLITQSGSAGQTDKHCRRCGCSYTVHRQTAALSAAACADAQH